MKTRIPLPKKAEDTQERRDAFMGSKYRAGTSRKNKAYPGVMNHSFTLQSGHLKGKVHSPMPKRNPPVRRSPLGGGNKAVDS